MEMEGYHKIHNRKTGIEVAKVTKTINVTGEELSYFSSKGETRDIKFSDLSVSQLELLAAARASRVAQLKTLLEESEKELDKLLVWMI